MSERVDRFSYDDGIVRQFLIITMVWGIVGMTVGLLLALRRRQA